MSPAELLALRFFTNRSFLQPRRGMHMKPSTFRPMIEALEDRSVPSATAASGTLTITGASASESVTVSFILHFPFSYRYRVSETVGATTTVTEFPTSQVQRVQCSLLEGNDAFTNNTSLPSTVYGGGGADDLRGGSGNDTLFGGGGNDTLRGGAGNDTLNGNDGDDYLYGDGGDDYVYCHAGNDIAWGGTGNDLLYGDDGHDALMGETGADILIGGWGDDDLVAGSDSDLDRLHGNEGADNFFQASVEEVWDFNSSEGDIQWFDL
jgi:Ca2+-binding RTX toxin-like protein